MRRLVLPLGLVALIVLLAACGGRAAAPAAEPGATAVEAPAAMQAPAATPIPPTATPVPPTATPVPPTPAAEAEAPPDAADLSGLQKLESFRATLSFAAEGTDVDDNPMENSAEITTEYVKEPPARRLVMALTGTDTEDVEQTRTVETVELGGTVYMKADDQWISISADASPLGDPDMQFLTDSSALFDDLAGFQRVRPDEEVNGISSRHYKFDNAALAGWLALTTGSQAKVDGDVWIANDGGYITRYVLAMQVSGGSGGALAPNLAKGTVTMSYELSDANEPIIIELPEEITGGLSMKGFEVENPFPLPEDGRVMMSSPDVTMVQTGLSPEEAAAFYESALTDLGWTKNEEESMAVGGLVSLTFDKAGNRLTLIMTSEGAGPGLTQIMAGVE